MRTDRDKRSENEREIDDFLSQFETPVEEIKTDVERYLGSADPAATSLYRKSNYAETEHAHRAAAETVSEKPKAKRTREPKANRTREPKAKKALSSIKDGNKSDILRRLFLKNNPYYDPNAGDTVVVKGKRRKNKPYSLSIKKLIFDCIGLGMSLCLCFFLYCFVIISLSPKIDASDIYNAIDRSSVIFDDEGKAVDTVFYNQDRTLVKYEQCPEDLVNAFVAIEDKTFWKHHGFNWTRMVGAVVSSVTGGGGISGTSTITQQLSRNVYLADVKSERSIKRKVLEMYYAAQIEKCLTKEQIIEAYMNTIYLGFGCYGVDAAAHAYYSTSVDKLTLEQCASLAALPQAPDSYALVQYVDDANLSDTTTNIIIREPDTYVANDVSKDRRDLCLYLMKDQGYITEDEYNKAEGKDLIDFIKPTIDSGSSTYAYFHDYLIDQVVTDLMDNYGLSYEEAESMVYTKGLKINSTLDSEAQKTIVKEFNDSSNFPAIRNISKDADNNILSKAGQIILYDYDNFFDKKHNFKLDSKECKINSDGSVTIKRGNRLNIYTTEYDGIVDYSLEFKPTYINDDTLYTYAGGYINIPADYKSLDGNDDLVIDASYFTDYPGYLKIKDDSLIITEQAYTLPPKTIQPQAAMTIVGVGTGEVKAMVGGRKAKGQRLFNRALNPRQPGSSIKPLAVYGAALQKSFELAEKKEKYDYTDFGVDKQGDKGWGDYITAATTVCDEKMHFEGRTWPQNASNGYSGTVTFRKAIQQSINTCAVKIQLQVGTDFSMQMLEKFGLTSVVTAADNPEVNDENVAALALGGMTNGAIPLEMALAYASFPAGGVRNTPVAYTTVEDAKGKVILTSKSEQTKVMDEGVAWIMTDVLKSVVSQGIAGGASVSGIQSGGKTGTTNDQYDIWFDGFTASYAGALWIGTDNNLELASMSGPAAALWGKIMNQLDNAKLGHYRQMPGNVIHTKGEYFTIGTETGLEKYKSQKEIDEEELEKQKELEEQLKKELEEAQKEAEKDKPTPAPTPTPTPTPTPSPDPGGGGGDDPSPQNG